MDDSFKKRGGLRPIELVVLVLTLLMLGGLFLVFTGRNRDTINARAWGMNNLKQIGLAIHNYAGTFQSGLPPLYSAPNHGVTTKGAPIIHPQSIFFTLLPYIEQDNLYKAGMGQGPAGPFLEAAPPSFASGTQANLTWMCQASNGPIYSTGFVKV
jgi:hypothetical protein